MGWWVGVCTFGKRTLVIMGGSGGGNVKTSTALTSGCGIACCPCTAYACNKRKQSFHGPRVQAAATSSNYIEIYWRLQHTKAFYETDFKMHALSKVSTFWGKGNLQRQYSGIEENQEGILSPGNKQEDSVRQKHQKALWLRPAAVGKRSLYVIMRPALGNHGEKHL